MIIEFTVVKGYQVASGLAEDPRFPQGTISAQIPFFKKLGLDLNDFYPATLNAKFNCNLIVLNQHDLYFKNIKWHSEIPSEDFKFYQCQILQESSSYSALIYQPQITTKTEHFQPDNQIELIAPYIEGIEYGDQLQLKIESEIMSLI